MKNTDLVLVAGATGGVGQLVVAKLLEKHCVVRALTRNRDKAKQMFDDRVEVAVGDLLQSDSLIAATSDVTHIICCTGTTAFPSLKWDFSNLFQPKNTPQEVDGEGVKHLVEAAPKDLKRFVFVSSAGVLRKDSFPFNILNAFGVLDAGWNLPVITSADKMSASRWRFLTFNIRKSCKLLLNKINNSKANKAILNIPSKGLLKFKVESDRHKI